MQALKGHSFIRKGANNADQMDQGVTVTHPASQFFRLSDITELDFNVFLLGQFFRGSLPNQGNHLMSRRCQLSDNFTADKAGSTCNKNTHSFSPLSLTLNAKLNNPTPHH